MKPTVVSLLALKLPPVQIGADIFTPFHISANIANEIRLIKEVIGLLSDTAEPHQSVPNDPIPTISELKEDLDLLVLKDLISTIGELEAGLTEKSPMIMEHLESKNLGILEVVTYVSELYNAVKPKEYTEDQIAVINFHRPFALEVIHIVNRIELWKNIVEALKSGNYEMFV